MMESEDLELADTQPIEKHQEMGVLLPSPGSAVPLQHDATEEEADERKENIDRPNEPHMLGIDEAGRGPVLGSMVYGTCWCPISRLKALRKMGFADSKVLSEQQREQLFALIKRTPWLGWSVDIIRPEFLSAQMLKRSKYNLNAISHDSAVGLIRATLAKGLNVQEIYVDTVGDSVRYQAKLSALFPGIKVVVEKKADSTYPIVSAASICAKVTRDHELENWSFSESSASTRAFGSGYPGDAVTKKWLQSNFDPVFAFPSLVRFSWSTCTKIVKEKCVPVMWGDEEDEDLERLQQHFPVVTRDILLSKRSQYFKSRHMAVVSSF